MYKETWCISCEEKEKEKIDEEYAEEEEEERVKRYMKIKLYKYIGESSRSMYERGLELKPQSHMLQHYCEAHMDEDMKTMEFGCRIIEQSRTAFNRQINESVEIQNNNCHYILNSKSEYNICALPRLSAKLGNEKIESLQKQKRRKKREKGKSYWEK